MSNRSLLEFNHDYCPSSDAECLALGKAIRDYMRGADTHCLPPGVKRYDYRHHSDPDYAATLAGLRDGTLVAVPREPVDKLLKRWRTWTPLQQPFIGTAKELKQREAQSREAGLRLMLDGAYLASVVAAAPEPGHG